MCHSCPVPDWANVLGKALGTSADAFMQEPLCDLSWLHHLLVSWKDTSRLLRTDDFCCNNSMQGCCGDGQLFSLT